jgi:hypothetical protein
MMSSAPIVTNIPSTPGMVHVEWFLLVAAVTGIGACFRGISRWFNNSFRPWNRYH